eukprot:419101_1
MLFTLIVSTLSCVLVFGADSADPVTPASPASLCALPEIKEINLLQNHHGEKNLTYVVRASNVKIQDVIWSMNFKSKNDDKDDKDLTLVPGCDYFSVHKTNEFEGLVAFVSIQPLMHAGNAEYHDKEFELVLSAFLGGDWNDYDPEHSQSVTIKNGAVHKPGNNLGRIVMHLIIIVFISVFISVYCGAYYWTKKNKQAQVVNENSTSNV